MVAMVTAVGMRGDDEEILFLWRTGEGDGEEGVDSGEDCGGG